MTPRRGQTHGSRGASLASLLVGVALACFEGGDAEVVWHPIPGSLIGNPDRETVVGREGSRSTPESVFAFVRRLRGHTVTASLGVFDGEPEQVFGMVWAARFLDHGSLSILDRQASLIRVVSLDGTYRYTIGGPGEAPGEFNVPLALVLPRPAVLWVVDGPGIVHRFRERDGRFEFVDRIRANGRFYQRDACASAGVAIVHGSPGPEGELLYVLDDVGNRTRAFAGPYDYVHRSVIDEVTRGRVACGDGVAILAYERLNRVDAYRPSDGELVWSASFEALRMPPIRERPTPRGRAVGIDVQGLPFYDLLLGLTGGEETPMIVQYARRTARDVADRREDRYRILTYVLDPLTGEGVYAGDDLPQILAATADHVVLLHTLPYPRVEIARLPR